MLTVLLIPNEIYKVHRYQNKRSIHIFHCLELIFKSNEEKKIYIKNSKMQKPFSIWRLSFTLKSIQVLQVNVIPYLLIFSILLSNNQLKTI